MLGRFNLFRRYRHDGSDGLARPDHFLRKRIAAASRQLVTQEMGRLEMPKSQRSLGQMPAQYRSFWLHVTAHEWTFSSSITSLLCRPFFTHCLSGGTWINAPRNLSGSRPIKGTEHLVATDWGHMVSQMLHVLP